jgi:hypothetical protein
MIARLFAHAWYWLRWSFSPSLRFGRLYGTIARYPIVGSDFEPARRFYVRSAFAHLFRGRP